MCLALLFLLALASPAPAADAAKKPNIVLIMADDFGYECVGCNGGGVQDAEPRRARGRRRAVHARLRHAALHADAACRS